MVYSMAPASSSGTHGGDGRPLLADRYVDAAHLAGSSRRLQLSRWLRTSSAIAVLAGLTVAAGRANRSSSQWPSVGGEGSGTLYAS